MINFSEKWKSVPAALRKPMVFVFGFMLVAVGVAGLALPIIPGWAAIFLGCAVLATEFAFAERLRDFLIERLKYLLERSKKLLRSLWQAIKNSWREPWRP